MYKVVKNAISKELAEFCYDYFCNKRKVARLFFDARYISQFNNDWGVWNDKSQPDTNRLQAMDEIAYDGYLFTQPDSAFYFSELQYDFAESVYNKKYI